jgi:hypothetical protein
MPFKDHAKQLAWVRAWRVANAEDVRRKKHAYYLSHRDDFAVRRKRAAPRTGPRESPIESDGLRSSRELARWRDIPGAARLPVRLGRRRKYLGTPAERHAQAQRIYAAKQRAKASRTEPAP